MHQQVAARRDRELHLLGARPLLRRRPLGGRRLRAVVVVPRVAAAAASRRRPQRDATDDQGAARKVDRVAPREASGSDRLAGRARRGRDARAGAGSVRRRRRRPLRAHRRQGRHLLRLRRDGLLRAPRDHALVDPDPPGQPQGARPRGARAAAPYASMEGRIRAAAARPPCSPITRPERRNAVDDETAALLLERLPRASRPTTRPACWCSPARGRRRSAPAPT